MAATLSAEQFELLQAHFAKFPKMNECPICHQKDWDTGGMEFSPSFANGIADMRLPVIPTVAVICTTCGFVRRFAWNVVTGKAKAPEVAR